MAYIRKEDIKLLNIDLLKEKLIPFSNLGKKYLNTLEFNRKGNEKKVISEYEKIKILYGFLSNKEFIESLKIALAHCESIPLIIKKAFAQETLELYEIQEIKAFVLFYERIRKKLVQENLTDLIKIFNLSDLLSFLDIEEKGIPSFYISSSYSEKLAEIRNNIAKLSTEMNLIKLDNFQRAKQELEFSQIEEKIVVSRYNQKLFNKLEESDWYYLYEENFANYSFHFHFEEKYFKIDDQIQSLISAAKVEEFHVRKEISARINGFSARLEQAQIEIAKLDWLLVRTLFMKRFNCVIPKISCSNRIIIEESINLPLKNSFEKSNISYQKIKINFHENLNLITGANMAGKTTSLKTVAQFVWLTALAIPVPCKSAVISLFDYIFFSGSSLNSNRMDLSSFGSEVVEINQAEEKEGIGLLLIDEFARGTNPQEGTAFSKAIFQSLYQKGKFVIATTHFDLGKFDLGKHYQIKGINNSDYSKMKINRQNTLEEKLEALHQIIDYQIEEMDYNTQPPKAALLIAKALGIDRNIIVSAEKFLEDLK